MWSQRAMPPKMFTKMDFTWWGLPKPSKTLGMGLKSGAPQKNHPKRAVPIWGPAKTSQRPYFLPLILEWNSFGIKKQWYLTWFLVFGATGWDRQRHIGTPGPGNQRTPNQVALGSPMMILSVTVQQKARWWQGIKNTKHYDYVVLPGRSQTTQRQKKEKERSPSPQQNASTHPGVGGVRRMIDLLLKHKTLTKPQHKLRSYAFSQISLQKPRLLKAMVMVSTVEAPPTNHRTQQIHLSDRS